MLHLSTVENLYRLELAGSPLLERALKVAAKSLLPTLLKQATCNSEGESRRYCNGAGVMAEVVRNERRAIEEIETTDTISMTCFDALLWTWHNNGEMAGAYIKVSGRWGEEADAEIRSRLNAIGGIARQGG